MTAPVGALAKLHIAPKDLQGNPRGTPVAALFNPAEIRRSRSVGWTKRETASQLSPWADLEQEYVSAEPETLEVELFFDAYEAHASARDVRPLTRAVANLAEPDRDLHHPPVCHLSWGRVAELFVGVLTSLSQTDTMFLPDGVPVRATVSATFTEFRTRAQVKRTEMSSADVTKSRVVRSGDTLHSLAAQEYGDPGAWRHIARANGIVRPLRVAPGTALTIPRLDR